MMSVPEFSYSCSDLNLKLDSILIEENLDQIAKEDVQIASNNIYEIESVKNGFKTTKVPGFDETLSTLWDAAQLKGLFRYQLTNLPTKIISETYRFILQLNPDRAQKRRKPQEITSLKQPFNADDFNFNKVKPEEIILQLRPRYAGSEADTDQNDEHLLIINVSPLEYGHVLLTPFRNRNNPQTVSFGGLRLAIELSLLSQSSDLRVGFNSLCGYASVNHEHYHAYYLKHRLYLESAELINIHGPCYEIAKYPAPGFVFVLSSTEEDPLIAFVSNILKLTSYLQEKDVAHNILITRGSSLCKKGHFDSLRVFVWARSSSFGAKGCEAFNPALCELGGHFPCKNETAYETVTEEFIKKELGDICKECFAKIRNVISELL